MRGRLKLGQTVVLAASVGCLPDSHAPPLLSHGKSLSPTKEVGNARDSVSQPPLQVGVVVYDG